MKELATSYDWSVVLLSVAIATFASYVSLHLARRVRSADRAVALGWKIGGALTLGTGIWAMHFIGMLSLKLPILLGYDPLFTCLSWIAASAASGAALWVASLKQLGSRQLAVGATVLGAGMCAMHFVGMAAIVVTPGMVWNWGVIAASVVMAAGISAMILGIFFWLRHLSSLRAYVAQAASAVVMGAALSGMHYTAMAAGSFLEGSVCLSVNALGNDTLRLIVTSVSMIMLGLTLITALLDARRQRHSVKLASSLRKANEKLRNIVYRDPLTGLANRSMFLEKLEEATRRCARDGQSVAVLFVDLDGFKPINDSFGHTGGDAVLCEVAARLRALVHADGTAARVGADEFLLLIRDDPEGTAAALLGREILDTLSQAYRLPEREVAASCSVGIVMHPQHGPRDKLVGRANAAMLASKHSGGSTYTFFEPRMEADARDQAELLRDLRGAVDRDEMELYYQPKIGVVSGQITAAEALLRWHHPTRGMIPPGMFIPIAERYGLIVSLGGWVIDAACRQIHEWREQGLEMRVAINLSAYQLRQERLAESVKAALAKYHVDPQFLSCEITESVAMEDTVVTQTAFERLSQAGIQLAIDDFGTGYSSLAYLRRLPAVELKIDRSFVTDLETNDADACAIIDAVVHLAHALGLKVVAEGVETDRQRATLIEMGCDELQGFLFAKPMPARALSSWAMDEEQSRSMALGLLKAPARDSARKVTS